MGPPCARVQLYVEWESSLSGNSCCFEAGTSRSTRTRIRLLATGVAGRADIAVRVPVMSTGGLGLVAGLVDGWDA